MSAFFSLKWSASAFWVECRNGSARDISWADDGWLNAYRIDGVVPPPEAVGGSRPGNEVGPGEYWQGMLDLRQSADRAVPVTSGAGVQYIRTSVLHRLTPGRHTIAIKCFDTWSDDVVFFWEPARPN